MTPIVSVIICTHNPRPDYLTRVLGALQKQTLPKEQWELLLIDNASKERLADIWDLSWHPRARHIREAELGLTPARLRGIKESVAKLLMFVDDDNELDPAYLKKVLKIHARFPQLGCFGAARILPEFAVAPPAELSNYVEMVGLKNHTKDHWSNSIDDAFDPIGAGLCVQRDVAERYASQIKSDARRIGLDRCGTSLLCHGDTDMVWVGCRAGYGKGIFTELVLTHLIPASRLNAEYLVNLFEAYAFSTVLLHAIHRPESLLGAARGYAHQLLDWLRYLRLNSIQRRFERARRRGKARGLEFVRKHLNLEKPAFVGTARIDVPYLEV